MLRNPLVRHPQAMMSTSGKVLSEKMDVFRLSFYTAPVSCLALLPFVYWREVLARALLPHHKL